eukprot:CAMPEP_0183462262 /NCGR_PEP_ID=MMETSP0370-20130417/141342_1 /TAXON_ID=268820 /ORGANISM="Peridinium aciculiferum, Strain PAER-2" /LENGTH=77 /DNA_ID=CAMNT_0025654275 /DNA_START=13 /DNA_END=246 /DNA_ORIENTATION=+
MTLKCVQDLASEAIPDLRCAVRRASHNCAIVRGEGGHVHSTCVTQQQAPTRLPVLDITHRCMKAWLPFSIVWDSTEV